MQQVICSFCGSTDVQVKESGLYILHFESKQLIAGYIQMYVCNVCHQYTYNDANHKPLTD